MKKKLIASLLVAAMVMTTLAGCGNGSSTQNLSDGTTVGETQNTSAEEAANGNFNETGYPIVNDQITLDVMLVIRDVDTIGDVNEMESVKALEEKTNIHINWEVIKGSDWDIKSNLMFASGEYPDVIMSMNSPVDYEEYGVTQKLLIPLDELIDQYMPIYTERAASEPSDVLAGLRASDGQMYSVGMLMAQNINTSAHYFLNQTWMDTLNLKTPTNINELTDVLRAFKAGDPNGNGEADEIPYELVLSNGIYGVEMALPMFGIPADGSKYIYLDENKKIQFYPTEQGFRDCMEWLNMLYIEGLVDVEMISQDANMLETKLATGNVGLFTAWRLQNMGFDEGVKKDAVLMNPVAADGYEVVMNKTMELAKRGAYITVGNENVPETLRWLDTQLETEMMFNLFAGMKDATTDGWKYNESGLIETYTGEVGEALAALNVNAMFFAPGEYYNSVYQMAPHRIEKIEYCQQYTEAGFMQENSNALLTLAPRSSEEIVESTVMETDIKNAVTEYMATFITKGVTDDSWNTFVKIFDNMDVDKLISIYQNALDNSVY